MINKNIFFMLAAGIFFGVLTAHPLHKVGNHLRRHALKYVGGSVATVGSVEVVHGYANKKYWDASHAATWAHIQTLNVAEVQRREQRGEAGKVFWSKVEAVTRPFALVSRSLNFLYRIMPKGE